MAEAQAGPADAPAFHGTAYEYTALNTLDALAQSTLHPQPKDKFVNLYGVVMECTEPRTTRGTGACFRARRRPRGAPPAPPSPSRVSPAPATLLQTGW